MTAGPLARYNNLVASGVLTSDPVQLRAAERLQALSDGLLARADRGFWQRLFSAPPASPRGLYLWGGVGRGKSLLMDIFYNNTPAPKKRRVHFHEFMADTHERIAAWRAASSGARREHSAYNRRAPDDPIPLVGYDLAADANLLCFDEFQVTDITDAMILGRLFEALFAHGVTIVATSNRHPDDLYKDGINRDLFLPTIAMMKEHLDILELDAARDYRLARLQGAPVYHQPLGAQADAAMDAAWDALICGAEAQADRVMVKGRAVPIPLAARGAARARFEDLCDRALGANDYLAIARRYTTLFLDHIPQMGPDQRNQARRFVNLIDALYEARVKFVCSADAPPEALYPAGDGSFEFARTASRLIEMQSVDYLGAEHQSIEPTEPRPDPQSPIPNP